MKTKELRLIEDGHGALPYQTINAMKEAYFIRNSKVTPGPASLDLVLSEECYKIKRVIFPKPGESVYKLIKMKWVVYVIKVARLFQGKSI